MQVLVEDLIQNLDRMVEDILGLAQQRFERYRNASEIERNNIRENLRATTVVILQALSGKPVDPESIKAVSSALGERRARQGYPLSSVMGMYQLAREVIHRYSSDAVARFPQLTARDLLDFSSGLNQLFDRFQFGVIDPYLQFQENIISTQQSFLKHRFNTLFKLVETISNNTDLKAVSEHLVDYLCRAYDLKVAAVYLLDERQKELYPQFVTGLTRRFQNEQRRLASESPIKRCLLEGKAVAVSDAPYATADLSITLPAAEAEPGARPGKAYAGAPVCSSLYAPMIGLQRKYGVISLHAYDQRRYTPAEVHQLEILARIATVALENARFYQSLLEEKGKLDAVINSMSDGLILIDFREEIIFINSQAAKYLQQPAPKLLGSSASVILERFLGNAKDPYAIQSAYLRAQTNIQDHPVLEFTLYKPEIADIRLSMFPVRDRENHFIARGLIIEDVSHEKEINRMKSDFVAIASHTMRTPMTSILGFASLLAENKVPPEAHDRYLKNIHRESLRLTNILNDMLDLANIEAGKISLKLLPMDTAELVQAVAADEAKDAPGRHLEVKGAGQKVPKILADRAKLAQALQHLVANALRYSNGKVTVTLKKVLGPKFRIGWDRSTVHLDAPGLYPALEVCVEDTGLGIPADQMDAIFEPFHRVSADPARFHEGSGLGLTIVRYIVEAHGGKLWAESKLEKGSAFTFILPLELVPSNKPLNSMVV